MEILNVKNLTLSYGTKKIISKVSFSLTAGEIIVILGASGDGKTTLMKALAGLLPIQSGEIRYKDQPLKDALHKLVPGHHEIKLVNQDFALDKYHTVEENVRLKLTRFDEKYRQFRTDTLLKLTGLNGYRNLKAEDLSGGQQQRLAIARALADEPELLLLDEPFNQLDFQNKQKIEHHVRSYLRKNNMSAILVTHNGIEAMEWADRIIFIRKGKVRRVDKPSDFFNFPTNKTEAAFFGELNHIKNEREEFYFRPGIFSETKNKTCTKKIQVSLKAILDLGWYQEYTFISSGKRVKIFSQHDVSAVKHLYIQPIQFVD